MEVRYFTVSMISVGIMVLGTTIVSGQTYPSKPIHFVTVPGGGAGDTVSRLIAPRLTGPLGQPVIIDNRPGIIAVESVAKAQPDGYTLIVNGSGQWQTPLLEKVSYDPVRDFSPITITSEGPNVVVVHPSLPVKSVKELIALAKARPGELNYVSGTTGSSTHLGAELFKAMAGVNIVRIQYKSAGQGINDLIGGQLELQFATWISAAPHVKSGRLRALAITTAEPSRLTPGLPTVAASGLPGYEIGSPVAIFAPAKTPAAIINRLNQEIVRVLNQADVKEMLFNLGNDVIGSSPEQLAARVKSDMARFGQLIKDAGIKAE